MDIIKLCCQNSGGARSEVHAISKSLPVVLEKKFKKIKKFEQESNPYSSEKNGLDLKSNVLTTTPSDFVSYNVG